MSERGELRTFSRTDPGDVNDGSNAFCRCWLTLWFVNGWQKKSSTIVIYGRRRSSLVLWCENISRSHLKKIAHALTLRLGLYHFNGCHYWLTMARRVQDAMSVGRVTLLKWYHRFRGPFWRPVQRHHPHLHDLKNTSLMLRLWLVKQASNSLDWSSKLFILYFNLPSLVDRRRMSAETWWIKNP